MCFSSWRRAQQRTWRARVHVLCAQVRVLLELGDPEVAHLGPPACMMSEDARTEGE